MLLIDETIGKRISYHRKKKGLKQYELALLAGIKPHYLNDIENGRKQPSIDLLSRLAVLFELSIDELVYW